MDIFGVELTVGNIITTDNVINFGKWMLSVVLLPLFLYFIRYKDSRINKLYGYFDKHEKLKINIKNNSDPFQKFVSVEIIESIERVVTKVSDVEHRNVFLYVLNCYKGKLLNKYNLKNLLEYIYFDREFKINFERFYFKQHLYKVYVIVSMLIFLISSFLFVLSSVLFGSLSTDGYIALRVIAIILLFASESTALIFFDKIIRKSKMIKYSNALAEIDASAFKPN
ncbi:hypothetical protein QPK77_09335 [Providencia rettgeri]|nr:hypothetical protein [Providencia rettgeri]MDK3008140.1 hypothetical protein [Providencia rettgeri]